MLGMSLLLTLAGAVLAIAVICAGADRAAIWRALRPRRRTAARRPGRLSRTEAHRHPGCGSPHARTGACSVEPPLRRP